MLAWVPALGLTLAGCDRPAACPPCECNCEGGGAEADGDTDGAGHGQGGLAGLGGLPGDLGELVAAANRKLAHGDGAGCLADLDRVKAIDPRLDKQLIVVRAQCQMAIGECQTGKQAITDYYVREQALTPERAAIMAESIASMRCAGGDATERDQLLAAYFDLSDGAHVNKRDVEFCTARVATIAELAPKVQPRDVEDTQITGGRQALFFTGAMCFARAGDCDEAYRHFQRFFPSETLDALDPSLRETTIRETFDSSVELCKP
jgi:hypothetical protein